MPRALYRIPVAAWAAGEFGSVAVAIRRVLTQMYVLAAKDPCPELEAAGATRLDTRLARLTSAIRAHFSCARVRRTETVDGVPTLVERLVSTADVLGDDTVLEADLPRVIIAGDDPAEYR